MLNTISLHGTLTADPVIRYTQNQTPVTTFRLAVQRDYVPKGQERVTDFIDCTAWRATAEFVSKHFLKGSKAVVNGRLQMREYTDKDGHKRTAYEVVCEHVYFGERRESDGKRATTSDDTFQNYDDDEPLPWE